MTPHEFFAAQNRVRVRWALPALKMTADRLRESQEFLDWCREQDIDPDLYVRARYDAVAGARGILIGQLKSPKFLKSFKQWGDRKQSAVRREERDEQIVRVVATRGLSSVFVEALRKARVNDRLSCLYELDTYYDEGSPSCEGCALAGRCRGR